MIEIIQKLSAWINEAYSDFLLFYKAPREYLYLFTYPKDQKVKIENYDPKVTTIGKKLVKKINNLQPDLKVHFIGSAVLGVAGPRDIDLYAESTPIKFDKYLLALTSLFGQPIKKKKKFIEWNFTQNNCNVSLLLIDPSIRMFYLPIETFKLIKSNKKILTEYKKIKNTSNGLSIREYQKRKLIFFNKIISCF